MTIDMQKQAASVSLEKAMKVSMEKGNDPGELAVQVRAYLDISGSMYHRYQGSPSEMELTVTRDLGLVLTGLDDDGKVPVKAFDGRVQDMGVVDENNYATFVTNWLQTHPLGGATRFMPIMEDLEKDGVPSKNEPPLVVIVHTDDAEPSDRGKFKKEIVKTSGNNVFWIFIGHGVKLDYLRDLDTMGGRKVDNVALIELDNASELSDGEYYDALIRELVIDWFPAARKAGITR